MGRWNFEPIFDSYLAVAVLTTLLILLLGVRPRGGRLNVGRERILVSLRLLLILCMAVAMLRPAHVSRQTRPQSASLLLLYDQSRSMSISDSTGSESRWQQMVTTLRRNTSLFKSFEDRWRIVAYSFAERLAEQVTPLEFPNLPATPAGQQTDLAAALDEALQRHSAERIAGVVLLSDGSQRVATPRLDTQQIARELNRLSIPLYTVPFGKPRDQSQARDVAIERLLDHYTVFAKNQLTVRSAIRVQGYVQQTLPVQVVLEGPQPGQRQVVGSRQIAAEREDQSIDVEFTIAPEQPGDYVLRVEVPRQPDELVTTNNVLTSYVKVLEGGLKIAYFDGNLLNPEAQVLRRSLGTSPDVQLDFQPIDLRQRDQWPIPWNAPTPLSTYDIFVIGDVPADALGPEITNQIADAVAGGKGLLMLGGLHAFGAGGYGNERLAKLAACLPITVSRLERQDLEPEKPIRSDVHLRGPLPMQPTRPHFITQLADDSQASLRAWQSLPPLLGANRWSQVHPRALRLAESPQKDPLLVAWEYEQGRVLVFAGDSTWRWWRSGQAELHRRFWRQAVLWLANQHDLLRRDVWIELDRRRFQRDERVAFAVGAKTETGEMVHDAQFTATWIGQDRKSHAVALRREGNDWRGEFDAPAAPGEYQVSIVAQQGTKELGRASARFQVESRDLELVDPAANTDQLIALSRLTAPAGGKVIPPEQLADLLRELAAHPPTMEVETETKWRFGDRSLDTWPFFLVCIGLLMAEWTLRKRWGLP